MTQDITNKVLLEHMQGMKYDLQVQIGGVDKRLDRLEQRVIKLEYKMDQGLEEARLHRNTIQEDLEETMRAQEKQGKKLNKTCKKIDKMEKEMHQGFAEAKLHRQAIETDLQKTREETKIGFAEARLHRQTIEKEIRQGLIEAKCHREKIQDELSVTMRIQAKHERKLEQVA